MASVLQYIGEISGGRHPVTVRMPVDAFAGIDSGTPVFLSETTKDVCLSGSKTVGVTMSDFKPEPNELDPTAGTGEVLVNISHDSLYKMKAQTIGVTSCSGRVIRTGMDVCEDALHYCKKFTLVLASKGSGSTNPHKIGSVLHVVAASFADLTLSLTCAESPQACAGDVYYVFPTYGFCYFLNAYEPTLEMGEPGCLFVVDTDLDEKTYTVKLAQPV